MTDAVPRVPTNRCVPGRRAAPGGSGGPAAGGKVAFVRKIPMCPDVLPATDESLPLPDVADHLGVPVTRVHALLQEGKLVAVERGGVPQVPVLLLDDDGTVNRFASGALAVLGDGGYRPEEALTWLYTEDESLPGRPIDALHGQLAREVIRRAQAMAF